MACPLGSPECFVESAVSGSALRPCDNLSRDFQQVFHPSSSDLFVCSDAFELVFIRLLGFSSVLGTESVGLIWCSMCLWDVSSSFHHCHFMETSYTGFGGHGYSVFVID